MASNLLKLNTPLVPTGLMGEDNPETWPLVSDEEQQDSNPENWPKVDSDFNSLIKNLQSDFKTKFNRDFRLTTKPGGGGLKGVHTRLYKGEAADVGASDVSDEEANYLLSRASEYGLRIKDYRNNWKSIGGSGPHFHLDMKQEENPEDFPLATNEELSAAIKPTTNPALISAIANRRPILKDKVNEEMSVSAGKPFTEDDLYREWYNARKSGDIQAARGLAKVFLQDYPQSKYYHAVKSNTPQFIQSAPETWSSKDAETLSSEIQSLTQQRDELAKSLQIQPAAGYENDPKVRETLQTRLEEKLRPMNDLIRDRQIELNKRQGAGAYFPVTDIEALRKRDMKDEEIIRAIEDSTAIQLGFSKDEINTLRQIHGGQFIAIFDPNGKPRTHVGSIIQQGKSAGGLAQFYIAPETVRELDQMRRGLRPSEEMARAAGMGLNYIPKKYFKTEQQRKDDPQGWLKQLKDMNPQQAGALLMGIERTRPITDEERKAARINGAPGVAGAMLNAFGASQGVGGLGDKIVSHSLNILSGAGGVVAPAIAYLGALTETKGLEDLGLEAGRTSSAMGNVFGRDNALGKFERGGASMAAFMFTPGGQLGVGIMGAMTQMGQAYQEMLDQGMNRSDAKRLALLFAPAGALEAFGVNQTSVLGQLKKEGIKSLVKEIAEEYVKGGAKETAQELTQNIMSDWIAQGIYDPQRNVFNPEQLWESAWVSFLLGGAGEGGGRLVSGLREIKHQQSDFKKVTDYKTLYDAGEPLTPQQWLDFADTAARVHAREQGMKEPSAVIIEKARHLIIPPDTTTLEPQTTTPQPDIQSQMQQPVTGLEDLARVVNEQQQVPEAPKLPSIVFRSDNGAPLEVLDQQGEAYRVRNAVGRTYLIHQNATFIPEGVTSEGAGQTVLHGQTGEPLIVLGSNRAGYIVKNDQNKIYNLHKNNTKPLPISSERTAIPETPVTLNSQMQALAAGRKSAVLITPGEQLPEIPEGFITTETPAGTFIHSPMISRESVLDAALMDNYHGLLGIVSPRPLEGEPAVTVVAQDKAGNELQTAIVAPEDVRLQRFEFKQIYPDSVVSIGDENLTKAVLTHRADEIDAQQLDSVENQKLTEEHNKLAEESANLDKEISRSSTLLDAAEEKGQEDLINTRQKQLDKATTRKEEVDLQLTEEARGLTSKEEAEANKARVPEGMIAVGPEDLGITGEVSEGTRLGSKTEISPEEMRERGFPALDTSKMQKVKSPQQIGRRLRNNRTPSDLTADLPSLHKELQTSNLDAHQQLEAYRAMGLNFKDVVQMAGTVRGVQSEIGEIPLVNILYRSGGKDLKYRVLGRFPAGEKILVMSPDNKIKIIQSPFGQTGNTRIKGGTTREHFGTIPVVKWQEIGMLSDAWPTKAEIHRVNPAIDNVLDLTDSELEEYFPEVFRRVREAQNSFGDSAGREMMKIASTEGDDTDSVEVQNRRDTIRALFNAPNIQLENAAEMLYNTAVVTGNDLLKLYTEQKTWSQKMIEKLGDNIKSYLSQIWDALHGQAPMFFSPLERAIKFDLPNKGTADQIKGIIRKSGVSDDEMKWTGFDTFLKGKAMREELVTKQEALDFFQKNKVVLTEREFSGEPFSRTVSDVIGSRTWAALEELNISPENSPVDEGRVGFVDLESGDVYFTPQDVKDAKHPQANKIASLIQRATDEWNKEVSIAGAPKFTSFTTPGGDNHKEITLSIPVSPMVFEEYKSQFEGLGISTSELRRQYEQSKQDLKGKGGRVDYEVPSGHRYGIVEADRNRIALLRVNDRVGPNGEKILHVDEYQDDLQNDIQKVKTLIKTERAKPLSEYGILRTTETQNQTIANHEKELDRLQNLLPFRGKSHELAMKYALGYAINHGYDMITWSTGRQVADRYSLRKRITEVGWQRNRDGSYNIRLFNQNDLVKSSENISLSDVRKLVADDSIVTQIGSSTRPFDTIGNITLYTGGEGKLHLYDRMIPDFMRKYTKKWKGEISDIQINYNKVEEDPHGTAERVAQILERVGPPGQASRVRSNFNSALAHSLKITPQMRDSILRSGQSLFGSSEGQPSAVTDAMMNLRDQQARKRRNPSIAELKSKKPEQLILLKEGTDASFKAWFGESKVVDEKGSPLVVYHGTIAKEDFDSFYPLSHFGTKEAAATRLGTQNERDYQNQFQPAEDEIGYLEIPEGAPSPIDYQAQGARTIPVYLSITSPLRIEDSLQEMDLQDLTYQLVEKDILSKEEGDSIIKSYNDDLNYEPFIQAVERTGHDGFVYRNELEHASDSWIPLRARQVKSTIGNKGTFDPSKPSILERIYDHSEEAAEMIDTGRVHLGEQMTNQAIIRASRAGRTIHALGQGGEAFIDYREKSNRLYLNEASEEILRMLRTSASGKRIDSVYGVALDGDRLQELVDVIDSMQQIDLAPVAKSILNDFSNVFKSSLDKERPLVVADISNTSSEVRSTVKHEEVHRVEFMIRDAFDGIVPDVNEITQLPHLDRLTSVMRSKGYTPDPRVVAMEAIARISTGDNKDLELTEDEELDFLSAYYTLMADTYHEEVLSQFKLITDKAREVRDAVQAEFRQYSEGDGDATETLQSVQAGREGSSTNRVTESTSRAVGDSYGYLDRRISEGSLGRTPIEDTYHISIVTGYELLKENPTQDKDTWQKELLRRLGERARPHLDTVWDLISGKAPTFYSPIENLIKTKVPNKASVDQIKGILKGVSEDELKWSGLNDLLKENKTFTKQELLNHLAVNNLKVETTSSGTTTLPHLTWSPSGMNNQFAHRATDSLGYLYEIKPNTDKKEALNFKLQILDSEGRVLLIRDVESVEAGQGFAEGLRFDKKKPEELVADEIELLREAGFIVDRADEEGEIFFRVEDFSLYRENVDDYLSSQDLPRIDLQDAGRRIEEVYHNAQKTGTRYSQYKLEGGSSYVELKITLPVKKLSTSKFEIYTKSNDKAVESFTTKEAAEQALSDYGKNINEFNIRPVEESKAVRVSDYESAFQSSHWDEPNVLAHIRGDEREHTDGVSGFVIDETQSDWATSIRKDGAKLDDSKLKEEINKIERERALIEKEYYEATRADDNSQRNEAHQRHLQIIDAHSILTRDLAVNSYRAPDAPLIKQWPLLTVKQSIRHAVERGLNRVSLMPARVHIDRWGTERAVWSKAYVVTSEDKYLTHGDIFDTGVEAENFISTITGAYADYNLIPEQLWKFQFKGQEGGVAGGIDLEQEGLARGILSKEGSVIVRNKEELLAAIKKNTYLANAEGIAAKLWSKMQKEDEGVSWPRAEGQLAHYGDTAEYIQSRFPSRPDLLKFAWDRADGKQSEAFMPIAMRDVSKAWKANVDVNEIEVDSYDNKNTAFPIAQPVYSLNITPQMSNAVIRTGQPLYGTSADDPSYVLDAKMRMSPQGRKNIVDMGIVVGHQILSKENSSLNDWSVEMIRQLGESIRPHLDSIWSRLHQDTGLTESSEPSVLQKVRQLLLKEKKGVELESKKPSTTGNEGTFDPNNTSILESKSPNKKRLELAREIQKLFQSIPKPEQKKYTNWSQVFKDEDALKALEAAETVVELESKKSSDKDKPDLSTLFDELVPPSPEPPRTKTPRGRRSYKAGSAYYEPYYEEGEGGSEIHEPTFKEVLGASQILTPWRAPGHAALEAKNFLQSWITGPDLSATLRQGGVAMAMMPAAGGKAFKKQVKAAFMSKEEFDAQMKELRAMPYFQLTVMMGTEYTNAASEREELFRSELADFVPWIRMSNQAMTADLNWLRYYTAVAFAKELQQGVSWLPYVGQWVSSGRIKGVDFEKDPGAYYSIGRFVNAITGRGDMSGISEATNDLLNTVMFSARMQKARIDLLNPYVYWKMPRQARLLTLRKMFEFTGLVMGVLTLAGAMGAKVTLDPDDSDFGKIVIGNTHFDITAGLASYVRVGALTIKNLYRGQVKKTKDQWLHFWRGKLAPVTGSVVSLSLDPPTDFLGRPATVGGEVMRNITPMFIDNLIEAYKSSGVGGMALASTEFVGLSASTYPPFTPPDRTVMEEKKLAQMRRRFVDEPLSVDDKARIDAENKIVDSLKAQKTDDAVKLFSKAIEDGLLAPEDEDRITKKSKMTYLQYNVSNEPFEDTLNDFLDSDMTQEERKAIASIVAQKYESWAKQREDEKKSGKITISRKVHERILEKIEKVKQTGILEMLDGK